MGRGPLDPIPILMHESVVPPAEQDEVVERGRTAVRPVLDVVCIQEPRVGAARERAPVLVPDLERTSVRGWSSFARH